MEHTRLILTGFMASGKSTLGKIIANTIGWKHKDLDLEIEKHLGKTIAHFFKEFGEEKFREIESQFLKEILKPDFLVLSLGGGTIGFNDNLSRVKEAGLLVYLHSTPEIIFERLKHKVDRPMFQTADSKPMERDEALKKISDILSTREQFYAQADLVFSTDKLKVGRAVDLLIRKIKPQLALSS